MKRLNYLLFAIPMMAHAQEFKLDQVNITESKKIDSSKVEIRKKFKSVMTSDVAQQVDEVPGVQIITNGGFASMPTIHGMADDRNKTNIDSMQVTSACPNHMNTALSYVDASKINSLDVYTGLVPVSVGGDSIGGVISAKTITGEYAEGEKNYLFTGEVGALYKSTNNAKGFNGNINFATKNQSLKYSGSTEKADNFKDGTKTKVVDTLYKQTSHLITFANKIDNGEVGLKLGQQHVPYEGFPTQYMDMNYNKSQFANAFANKKFGELDANIDTYIKSTDHYMNKILSERTGNMPMNTWSQEWGYKFHFSLPLNSNHKLKFGHELYKFLLNDWWPSAGMGSMQPNTFLNINHGTRDRIAFFIESDSDWNKSWSTNIGMRTEFVKMNTGNVHGYNDYSTAMGNLPADASAFNASDKKKNDSNIDLTSRANYKLTESFNIDFGYARKTRSPNLYERYSWAGSTTSPASTTLNGGPVRMDMRMINWFGDGNGYVGNLNLKPEVAHVVSTTFDYHSTEKNGWKVKLTPHLNTVENYIDADLLTTYSNVAYLQFANHNALLWGADLQAKSQEFDAGKIGIFNINFSTSYLQGKRTDGLDNLYNIAPLNGKFAISHKLDSWTSNLELVAFAKKSVVSTRRLEIVTPGYALLNLRTRYSFFTKTSIDVAVENIFNRQYQPALGGRDVIDNLRAMRAPGRSFNVAFTQQF